MSRAPDVDGLLGPLKDVLRRSVRAHLVALDPVVRRRQSEAAAAVLAPWVLSRARGGPVALFASLPWEIETAPLDEVLRDAGLPRAVPAIVGRDLEFRLVPPDVEVSALPQGSFRVPTPGAELPRIALADCAVIVCPGLLFDRGGRRLGYGRGFYDRALRAARTTARAPTVGLFLDLQWCDGVPHGASDETLDWLCSAGRGVVPRRRRRRA